MMSVRRLPAYPGFNAEAGITLAKMLLLTLGLLPMFGRFRPNRKKSPDT